MKRWLSGIIVAITVIAAFVLVAVFARPAKAVGGVNCSNDVTLDVLANADLLKLSGRTIVESGYLTAEYSGTGFETNITVTKDSEIKLVYLTNYMNKLSVFIDGEKVKTELIQPADGELFVPVTAGAHTVKVVKESQLSSTTTAYFRYKSIGFPGTVDSRPEDKELLVEVIGDSYSCGDGADARYEAGTAWTSIRDDAITKSFGWYLSEMMGADFNEVGRGGQGLDGTAAQEAQSNKVTMPILFDYVSYGDQASGKVYETTRTPNLVVIELGANDTCNASNQSNWVSIAKNFILKIKKRYGDVPIVWALTGQKSYFYTGLYEAFESDKDLSAYDNLYVMYNYLNRNGSAALASQKGGHPDEIDQRKFAERLYDFIETEGVLKTDEEPEHPNDLVYYVSDTGNDAADGLTFLNAKLTVGSALTAARGAINGKKQVNGTRIVVKVQGNVVLTGTQNFTEPFQPAYIPYCQDGTMVPIIIETMNYVPDGNTDTRATVSSTFTPVNSGNASSYSYVDLTFKNVKLHFAGKGTGNLSVLNIYNQNGNLTFDNTSVSTASGGTVNVSANGFSYVGAVHDSFIKNGVEHTNVNTFLHGVYDKSTGFGTIAAVGGTGSYWASAGSYTSAPSLTCKVVVGEGAVLGNNLRILATNIGVKEAIVEVTTGGKVLGMFQGTASGSSTARTTFTNNATLNITGGHFEGPLYMMGDYANLNGNLTFNMTGGEIVVPTATTAENSNISLASGTKGNTINGNSIKNISGGIIWLQGGVDGSGSALQTSVHFSGRSNTVINGNSENTITAGAILVTPSNPDKKQTASGVYFGGFDSCAVNGELINRIEGGIIDQTQYGTTIYYGSQGVVNGIKKLTNIIGVQNDDGRNEGPVHLGSTISMGAGWGQYGVTAYSGKNVTDAAAVTSDEIVVSTTVYGGQFGGAVNLTPTGNVDETNKRYPRTEGSIQVDVYGGDFEGTTNIKSSGRVYGHVECNIHGGNFTNINGVTGGGLVTDGVTINIYDMVGYGKVDSKTYSFDALVSGSVQALTYGRNAFECNIEGGYARMNLLLDDNSGVVTGNTLVQVKDGWFGSVTGALANGAVSGGTYATAPASNLLATGKSVQTFAMKADQFYTCEVTDGTASHVHCECVGNAKGVGTHVCNDNTVWTPVASMADFTAMIGADAPMEGYYYLTRDIHLTGAVTPKVNQKLHICLNGHTLWAENGCRAFMLYLASGGLNAELNITDCSAEETGEIVGGYHSVNGATILIFSGSNFNLFAGTIRNGRTGYYGNTGGVGGNVNVTSGCTFNMYGGTIRDGSSYGHGGNVVISGTFNMYDGTISGGRSIPTDASKEGWLVGGNLYASTGTVNIFGGTIKDGKSNYGGNVYGNKVINISGGLITGGEALVRNGGNILIDKNGQLNISGSAIIEKGKAKGVKSTSTTAYYNGGNIYLQGGMNMTGGIVRDGEATNSGGNIYMNPDNASLPAVLSGGTISGGKARIGGSIAVYKQDVTITGDAVITGGEAVVNATGGDGHGGNIYMGTDGCLYIKGGTIKDGIAATTCNGANISCTAKSTIEMSGGLISGGKATGGKSATTSIHYFAATNSVFKMTGGTIAVDNDSAVAIGMEKTTGASISGGNINGTIIGDSTGFITGGNFTTVPAEKYLGTGCLTFDLNPTVTEAGKTFYYEIAKGFNIELTSREENGTESIATLTGGGKYKENASYTLTAPDMADKGFDFLYWEDEGGTKVSEEQTLTGTVTENLKRTAVYKSNLQMLELQINADQYTITIGDGEAKTDLGFNFYDVPSGTKVSIEYTGTDYELVAWINESYRYLTKDKAYEFTMYTNRFIGAATSTEEACTMVIYLNTANQVLCGDIVTGTYTQYLTTPPDRLGLTNGTWDKSIDEINELIAAGETVIELHPIYESKEEKGTITVKKVVSDAALTTFNEIQDGTTSEEYPIENRITFNAEAITGYKFAGFADVEKKMLSYSDSIVIRPVSGKETVLYEVYVAEDTTVDDEAVITVTFADYTNDAKTSGRVEITRHIPETYVVVEQGMVISKNTSGITDAATAKTELVIDNTAVALYHSANTDNDGMLSLNMKNLPATDSAYIRGYVIIADAAGKTTTLYSDVIELNQSTITVSK